MPGGSKKGGGLETVMYKKSSPMYKMKGFSGFGNSPLTDRGHGGKEGHVHPGSKGMTKDVVDVAKKTYKKVKTAVVTKAKKVIEDPIGEYVKAKTYVPKKIYEGVKSYFSGKPKKKKYKKLTPKQREKFEDFKG